MTGDFFILAIRRGERKNALLWLSFGVQEKNRKEGIDFLYE